MHTLSPVQLRHLAFKDPLSVLTRAQLLLCFGFFVAEVGKVGFGLGHGITLLFQKLLFVYKHFIIHIYRLVFFEITNIIRLGE